LAFQNLEIDFIAGNGQMEMRVEGHGRFVDLRRLDADSAG
jgi:hypothetical protein